MRINKQNIDNYYQIVNDKIDQHFGKYINPSHLQRYLAAGGKGIKKFIEQQELQDVEKIEKIVTDCVQDRLALSEKDIMTFESFTSQENTDLNIVYDLNQDTPMESKETNEILRDIADIFETSVSKIKFLDDTDFVFDKKQITNRLSIETVDGEKEVIFFNNFFVYEYLEVISKYIYDEITDDEYSLPFLNIKIDLKQAIDEKPFISNTKYFILNNKIDIFKHMIETQLGGRYEFFGLMKGLLIFEKK